MYIMAYCLEYDSCNSQGLKEKIERASKTTSTMYRYPVPIKLGFFFSQGRSDINITFIFTEGTAYGTMCAVRCIAGICLEVHLEGSSVGLSIRNRQYTRILHLLKTEAGLDQFAVGFYEPFCLYDRTFVLNDLEFLEGGRSVPPESCSIFYFFYLAVFLCTKYS